MSIRLVGFPESRPGFGDRSSSTARPRGVHITSSFELHHSPHPLTTTLAPRPPQQHRNRNHEARRLSLQRMDMVRQSYKQEPKKKKTKHKY
jgi:hypothetical protein